MSDPQRLLDDPAAPAELRAALAAEQRRVEPYDPAPLGARVASAIATGAPLGAGALPASWWLGPKAMLATAVVSAALGAGGHVLYAAKMGAPSAPPPPPVAVAPAPPPSVEPAVEPAPKAPPAPAPPSTAPSTATSARGGAARGALVEELRLYERGEAALLEGHLDVAVRELERYLAQFPRGTLRAEAELALVQALAKSGRCEQADARVRRAPPGSQREALRAAARQCSAGR